MGLTTRHLLHPQPNLGLFIKVLRLSPLIMPLQNILHTLLLLRFICRHGMVKIRNHFPLKQFLLSPYFSLFHQAKGLFRSIHAISRLRYLMAAPWHRLFPFLI